MSPLSKYGVELGPYEHVGTEDVIIVTDVITHGFEGGVVVEHADQLVVYRDLSPSQTNHVRYSMKVSDFKLKFRRI